MALILPVIKDLVKLEKKKRNGHAKRKVLLPGHFNADSKLRVGHLQELFGISNSTVYAQIAKGKIKPPDGRDGKTNRKPYWRAESYLEEIKEYQKKPRC